MKHQQLKTTPEISKRMSRVHLKRGQVESKLAKALWHRGIYYRLNVRKLPGSPDIVIRKYKIVIFVDGEFWHGKDWEQKKEKLKNNRSYWIEKIEENMARDRRVDEQYSREDWTVLRFWSKQVEKELDWCVGSVMAAVEMRK